MDEKSRGKLTDWAQLRFSIIGGLLASPPKRGDLQEELKCLAGRCYPHPTEDKLVRFVNYLETSGLGRDLKQNYPASRVLTDFRSWM